MGIDIHIEEWPGNTEHVSNLTESIWGIEEILGCEYGIFRHGCITRALDIVPTGPLEDKNNIIEILAGFIRRDFQEKYFKKLGVPYIAYYGREDLLMRFQNKHKVDYDRQ